MRITLTIAFIMLLQTVSSQVMTEFPFIRAGIGNEKEIELSHLDISVFVLENIATTTLDMKFYNGNGRVMEGELNFPLPEGVTVSRFALDVNGEMREGVVAEKEKAAMAFEVVTRLNIDPGIVEATRGNSFKARIYPIPAKGYKKIIIAFEQELTGDGKSYLYQLPLNFKNRLEEFSVKAEVAMSRPAVYEGSHPAISLEFREALNSYISEYHETDVLPDQYLAFSVPRPEKSGEVITYRGQVSSDNFFYINLDLEQGNRARQRPRKIAVVWDESSSGGNREIEKELNILERYFEWMNSGTVQLITFSHTLHTGKEFIVADGRCIPVIEELKKKSYDGGTNLYAIDFSRIDADEILLFTDGISNFGIKGHIESGSPVTAINSSGTADHSLLEYLAFSSDGIYANASELTEQEVFSLMTHQPKRFIRADYDSGTIKELFPGTGRTVSGNFSCAGKAEGSEATITLHFGYGGEITESHHFTIDNSRSLQNDAGERIWAQKKLKYLLVQDNDEAIKAHGKKYSLVTPGTSLMVLDEAADYVRFKITPPPSLQKKYNELLAIQTRDKSEEIKNRKQLICSLFESDYRWWESVKDYRGNQLPETVEERTDDSLPVAGALYVMDADYESEESPAFMILEDEESADMMLRSPAEEPAPVPVLRINTWDSHASYMGKLKATAVEDLYEGYLSLKPENEGNPSFYFDVATYMFQKSLREKGLRVISNLAELELENTELLRMLGRKLSENRFYDEAVAVFKVVLKARPFEPHSYIDLGLTCAEMGQYQEAVDYLYTVIDQVWEDDIITRFPEIELIVLHEINNIIDQYGTGLDLSFIDPCFIRQMQVDIRIVIDWDANDTDIDLWITDPRGEKCFYKNRNTRIGGRISKDITMGYGPEEFRLKHAPEGTYVVEANYYGTRRQSLLGYVTVRAFVYTNFGSPAEQKEVLTLLLEPDQHGSFIVGEIEFAE